MLMRKNSVESKWGPKMEVFGENGGRNLRFWFRDPPKGTFLRGTASFDVFCVKIGARVSAVAFLKNPQKSSRVTRGAKSRMSRTETPKLIWIKFCVVVDIPDVVTYTNFGDHRLRGFWVAGGQISPSPIDFHRRPYDTLALPCVGMLFRSVGQTNRR